MSSGMRIDQKATRFANNKTPKPLTIDDLDEFIGRRGKPSPTIADCMRFAELSMAIEEIFTAEESERWFKERHAMILGYYKTNSKEETDTRLRSEAEAILSRQNLEGKKESNIAVMQPMYLDEPQCRICHAKNTETVKLLKCSVCRSILYCGVDHQKQDWKRHKKECKQCPR
eukprot:gene6327-8712_t